MANRRYPRINRVNLGDDPDKHLADGITSLIADLRMEQDELAHTPELIESDPGAPSPLDRNEWDSPLEPQQPVVINVTFTFDEDPSADSIEFETNQLIRSDARSDTEQMSRELPLPCGLEYSLARGHSGFFESTRLEAITPRVIPKLRLPPLKEVTRGVIESHTGARSTSRESGDYPIVLPHIEVPGRPRKVTKKTTDRKERKHSKSPKR